MTHSQHTSEPRTYGHHQERAAAALNQLLVTDALPLGDEATQSALAARVRVIDNLHDRLRALGAPTPISVSEDRALRDKDLGWIQQWPVTTLDQVVAGLPRPTATPDDDRRDLDLGPSGDPAVVLWHQVSDELLLANDALLRSEQQPWRTEPGPAWHLVGDTAACVEAVVVLDDRLREVGLLSGPDYPNHPSAATTPSKSKTLAARRTEHGPATSAWTLDEVRLVTSQQMRLAGWYGNGASVDITAATTPRQHVAVAIQPVRQVSDVALAQRQLARYLAPVAASTSFVDAQQRMDAATFRVVARNQERLCHALHERFAHRPGAQEPAAAFARLRDQFADLSGHSRQMHDHERRGTNTRAQWQQREISQGMNRLSYFSSVETAQGMDLAGATHQVLRDLAGATRHEANRANSNLRISPRTATADEVPSLIQRRSPLALALSAATRSPAPTAPAATWLRPVQRSALQATLDTTPARTRAPLPLQPQRRAGPRP